MAGNGRPWELIADPRPWDLADIEPEGSGEDGEGLDDIAPFLSRIPEREAQYLVLRAQGRTYREIASAMGVDHAAVIWRMRRLVLRLRWIRGPGSWATPSRVSSVARSCGASAGDAELVAVYWETTSLRASAARLRLPKGHAWRSIRRGQALIAEGALSGVLGASTVSLGLSELFLWGRELLEARGSHLGTHGTTL